MARTVTRLLAFGAFAVALSGCGLFGSRSSGQTAPAPLDVVVEATERLNPDDKGQPLPTVVRIYQLKTATRLENTEVERVYRNPKEALGEDLVVVDEITLSPGESQKRHLERDPAAHVVAVVAVFRRPTATSWRAMAELPAPSQGATLRFSLDGYRVDRH